MTMPAINFAELNINFAEVHWYAQRASAAYDPPYKIQQKFPNTVRVKTLDEIDVQYFLEHIPDEKIQVISVRGTANLENAKEDADYLQSKNKKLNIYVHKGFDEDAMKIYHDIKPHLLSDHSLKLTGHSLGAAISTLLMMYLHEDGYNIVRSINFGQPKVTNKRGVKRYDFLPLTRIVDEEDIVPLVPPVTLLDSVHGFYEHLGDEVILLPQEFYVYLEKHVAERKSVGSFWKSLGHQSIKEHFMRNYLKNIYTKLNSSVPVPYDAREEYLHH
jgi:predicted lipase